MWSFATKGIAVLVLRYKRREHRDYKAPLNFSIAGHEVPVGLTMITVVFFVIFTVREKMTHQKQAHYEEMDEFNLNYREEISTESLGVRANGVLVPVHNPRALEHLAFAIDHVDTRNQDIAILHVRLLQRAAFGEHGLATEQLFGDSEQLLFTKALERAVSSRAA